MQPETGRRRLEFASLRMAGALLLAAAIASGCATTPRPPPLTMEQIVEMSKENRPAAEIIKELNDSRTVLPLSGSQYAKLKQEGVPDEVLDHLQKRYLDAVEFDARMRYQTMYWGWGWGPPGAFPHRPMVGRWPYWYYW